MSTELADVQHNFPHLGLYSSASNSTSTTTTGCLIAAVEAEIRKSAEAVITTTTATSETTDTMSECTSRTETPLTGSETSQFTPLTSLNAANATLTGALLEQPIPIKLDRKRHSRRHRKSVNLLDPGSEDQASDIRPLNLSPGAESYSSLSSTLTDSDSEELQTIRRKSKAGSVEKVSVSGTVGAQPGSGTQSRPRTPRNSKSLSLTHFRPEIDDLFQTNFCLLAHFSPTEAFICFLIFGVS